jgi:hypothetical protein
MGTSRRFPDLVSPKRITPRLRSIRSQVSPSSSAFRRPDSRATLTTAPRCLVRLEPPDASLGLLLQPSPGHRRQQLPLLVGELEQVPESRQRAVDCRGRVAALRLRTGRRQALSLPGTDAGAGDVRQPCVGPEVALAGREVPFIVLDEFLAGLRGFLRPLCLEAPHGRHLCTCCVVPPTSTSGRLPSRPQKCESDDVERGHRLREPFQG